MCSERMCCWQLSLGSWSRNVWKSGQIAEHDSLHKGRRLIAVKSWLRTDRFEWSEVLLNEWKDALSSKVKTITAPDQSKVLNQGSTVSSCSGFMGGPPGILVSFQFFPVCRYTKEIITVINIIITVITTVITVWDLFVIIFVGGLGGGAKYIAQFLPQFRIAARSVRWGKVALAPANFVFSLNTMVEIGIGGVMDYK